MPITLEIQAAILIIACIISAGGGWAFEYKQYAELKASVDTSDRAAAKVLAEKTAEADKFKSDQTISNIQRETEHAKTIERNAADNASLVASSRLWASNQARNNCPLPKAGNTGSGKKDDGGGYYLSAAELTEELDKLIPKALLADGIDAELHYTLTWLRSLPPEIVE